MSSITGQYQHYKNENIDDYFSAVGVPYMGRKMMGLASPLMEIAMNDDKVTIKTSSLMRKTDVTFKLNEEYEEQMPGTLIKSKTKLQNNELITESVIPETGVKCWRHYIFNDDECIVTLTHEKAKVPGKRYFKRVTS